MMGWVAEGCLGQKSLPGKQLPPSRQKTVKAKTDMMLFNVTRSRDPKWLWSCFVRAFFVSSLLFTEYIVPEQNLDLKNERFYYECQARICDKNNATFQQKNTWAVNKASL